LNQLDRRRLGNSHDDEQPAAPGEVIKFAYDSGEAIDFGPLPDQLGARHRFCHVARCRVERSSR
jgi:hypothetical protein